MGGVSAECCGVPPFDWVRPLALLADVKDVGGVEVLTAVKPPPALTAVKPPVLIGGGCGVAGVACEVGGCGLWPLTVDCNAAEAFLVGVSSGAPVGVLSCDFFAGDVPGDGVYGPPLSISTCWCTPGLATRRYSS